MMLNTDEAYVNGSERFMRQWPIGSSLKKIWIYRYLSSWAFAIRSVEIKIKYTVLFLRNKTRPKIPKTLLDVVHTTLIHIPLEFFKSI